MNNLTEQQEDKTKEPPLSQQVSSDDSSSLYQKLKALPMKHYPKQTLGEYLADAELGAIMQLIHQYGNTRELEGRISERENTELPTTDHSECFDKRTCTGYQNAASDLYNENLIRIDELTKAKETPHETS